MAYYKVVKKIAGGDLVSVVVVPSYADFYRVYQRNGENLKVKNGMAFNNLTAAHNFLLEEGGNNILEIWTCTGRKIALPRCVFDLSVVYGNAQQAIQILKRILFHGSGERYGDALHIRYASYRFPTNTVRLRGLKLKEKAKY